LFNDYVLQLGLTFYALKQNQVEFPVVAAIGCGVFGRAFAPEYQRVVARTFTAHMRTRTHTRTFTNHENCIQARIFTF
jgi:hypothetical protein